MAAFLEPSPTSPEAIHITIRFPDPETKDLLLTIQHPSATTVIALKHLVRQRLTPPSSLSRFRFIHSGKLLKDADYLSQCLRIPTPPPFTPSLKGKEVEPQQARVYINCSIGDVLSSEELAAEAQAAERRTQTPSPAPEAAPQSSTTPAPRGFDRLLQGGFTVSEVNALRLQFRTIQSSIHTPETMPSPSTILQMEEAWIDSNASAPSTGPGFDFGDEGLGGGAMDDLLWGNIMGFFWPLGAVGWAIREGGIWSRRRQISVVCGVILSFSFGLLGVLS